MFKKFSFIVLFWVWLLAAGLGFAQEKDWNVYPTAIFALEERGVEVKGLGSKAADLLYATLTADPNLMLVERGELDKILSEHELNLSGVVNPSEAIQIGALTGARLLLTGSVFKVQDQLYVVAKIMGTETGRVLGKSVMGKEEDLPGMVQDLSGQISEAVSSQGSQLVAVAQTREDRIAKLNNALKGKQRPVVMVKIKERHVSQATIDPAAQTEFIRVLKETGFEVIDPDQGNPKDAAVIIQGEGFSEFAMRKGNLVSVKAILDLKVTDSQTDRIIATDMVTTVQVDLTEQIAGKKALREAAAILAERVLPKIVQ